MTFASKIQLLTAVCRKTPRLFAKALLSPFVAILALLMLQQSTAEAQSSLSYGIDFERDSVAFAHFRHHMDSIRAERPTIALVLSGGGAKGAAHISVIRYLEQVGIPIDLVMGTSIGGLVGGLYACGYTGEELEAIIRNQDWDYLLRDTHPRSYDALREKDYDRQFQIGMPYGTYKWDFLKPEINRRSLLRDGIVHGRNIEDLLSSLTVGYGDEMDFLSLPIPFVCVASDMISAKPKIWHSGSLVTAMRSSMSIPGLFTPVRTNGMVLTDGSMRSNFPAEIAKRLGADIIIGVDISSPALSAGQMRSLMDVVYQASDMMGREAYVAAIEATDIYIQPELSDFSLLSFDNASISTMLERGRQAVLQHADEINRLKRRLDGADIILLRHTKFKKAIDLHNQTVKINDIKFAGISAREEKYLRRRLKFLPMHGGMFKNQTFESSIHIVELEKAIAEMMGTKAFEKVTYEILGNKEPYTLLFNCFRAPVNQFGGSVRFDAVDFASLLLNLGINTHKLTGGRVDLTARLGLNSVLSSSFVLSSGRGADLGLDLSFQAARNGAFRSDDYDLRIDFNRARGDAYVSFAPWRQMNIRMGLRADYFYRTTLLADMGMPSSQLPEIYKYNTFIGPFLLVRSDSFDDPYFPTRGIQYKLAYNWYQHALQYKHDDFHAVQFDSRWAHTKGVFTLLPSVSLRHVTDNVLPYINMLAVGDANRTLDQQIVFAGISTPYATARTLATAALHFRFHLAHNHYITATAQAMHQSDQIEDFVVPNQSSSNYGFALEYAYRTLAGPLRLNVHWSDLSKSIGFYVGIGLDF